MSEIKSQIAPFESEIKRQCGDTLIAMVVYNEGLRVQAVLKKLFQVTESCNVLVVDDGSNDETSQVISQFNCSVLRHPQNTGVGASLKDAVRYARDRNYRFVVTMAGNGKMDPFQIEDLLAPLRRDECDYVQGSRYLEGGRHENLPFFRNVMIRILTFTVWLFTGFKGTDVTCGFRAYKLSLFDDSKIKIWQTWLDHYEFEYYLHYKVIELGYRIKEVPVSMIYPTDGRPYSKIKPFAGWWSMVRPLVLLSLKLRD
jgi:dolichol-phosphate mannosyltransferase